MANPYLGPCPVCQEPTVAADHPLRADMPFVEYLPAVRRCVKCFDRETLDSNAGRWTCVGRVIQSPADIAAAVDRSRHDATALPWLEGRRPAPKPAERVRVSNVGYRVAGQDLRRVLVWCVTNLPALAPLRGRDLNFTVREHRSNWSAVSGRATGSTLKLHLTIGRYATLLDAVGVLLHEAAHLACYAAGEPWLDTDDAFADRCVAVMDEWTDAHPDIRVNPTIYGAYRGEEGRANVRARRAAARFTPEQVAALKAAAAAAPTEAARRALLNQLAL